MRAGEVVVKRFVLALLAVSLAAALGAQTINEYDIGPGAYDPRTTNPYGIARGPDGNMWFTESYGKSIGQIAPDGTITTFPEPSGFSQLYIAQEPGNGPVWATSGGLDRITANPVTVTPFAGVTGQGIAFSDDYVWVSRGNGIARADRTNPGPGNMVTYPTVEHVTTTYAATLGSDGNIWFIELDHYNAAADHTGRVAKIDLGKLSGCDTSPSQCITEYPIPGGEAAVGTWMTSGPDGALWTAGTGKVNRITTDGAVTQFDAASASAIGGITAGPDGALWYAGSGNHIGRITTAGSVTELTTPSAFSPRGIAAGPNGTVWFTEISANKIGVVRGLGPQPNCQSSANTLCLNGGRFAVSVAWSAADQGTSGAGMAVPLTGDTGYFWFFNAANVELVLKVLDASGINHKFWVFYGALSDVAYRISITDTETNVTKVYENPYHHLASFADTGAFDAAVRPPESAAIAPPLPAEALEAGTAPCAAGGETLCLNGGRFEVTVSWSVPAQGQSGTGKAIPISGDTGYFWFFSENNVELILKVLDGRSINGHFWVFYGALSNVQYTITVRDTQTGTERTYENASGDQASHADTSAF